MSDADLADRILAALAATERRDRRPLIRTDQLLARLDAELSDVRSTLYALDTDGLIRFTPGFVAGDVVLLQPAARYHLGLPPLASDESTT